MDQFTLYSFFRSSCSARLRIALHLKSIPFTIIPVNLVDNEQLSDSHRALNPSAFVPLLHILHQDGTTTAISQSLAAIEYLDEVLPLSHPLLPPASNPDARAASRTLASIIACDVQPVTNLRIMRRVRALGGSAEDWNKDLTTAGLHAYETLASKSAGIYSVGDDITIADVCLLPAYWNAQRFGVDLAPFPTVNRIADALGKHPACVKAHWQNQPDTPDEFKSS